MNTPSSQTGTPAGITGSQGTPLLSVRNLTVEFHTRARKVKALRGIDLDLFAGQTLALVGESGSGKSVTSLALMRLLASGVGRITSGSAILQTDRGPLDLATLPESAMRHVRGRLIAMIFQEPMTSLNPVLTVGDQIGEIVRRHLRYSRADARAAAIALLDRVGISSASHRVDSYPHEFSGGMRQRVMIAMALACKPLVMIADEPTTALDVTVQAQILDLIMDLQRETNMAVLFITHNLGVVARVADRTMVMYAGELMESGATDSILISPRHPYTRGLLNSLPPEIDQPFDRDGNPLVPIKGQVVDIAALPAGCCFAPRCPHAAAACEAGSIPLEALGEGRAARCLRLKEIA
jgi:peptide/nickel transport system ATP-binding protein